MKSVKYGLRGLCALVLATIGATAIQAQVPCLSGFITDGTGAAVARADVDFFDPVTGVKLVTPNDNSDGFGFYNVCVLPGIFDVAFAPPPNSHLRGRRFENIDLTSARELNVVLDAGLVIQGLVSDTLGLPVGNVDLDVDLIGGGRLYTPDDNTDPITGRYWIVVPRGDYRIRYQPPAGSRLRGIQIDTVSVRGDTVIDMSLPAGLSLSGQVTDEATAPVPGIDVELRDAATGRKVYVANNTTDTAGRYAVAVPAGLFDLRFAPPRGSRYLAVLVDSLAISGDLVRNQLLEQGLLATLIVRDTVGTPVPGVDIDFKSLTTGLKLFTPGDNTDVTGTAILTVPPDLYSIEADPPPGSLFEPLTLDSVQISGDTTLTLTLRQLPRVRFSGQLVDSLQAGVAGVEIRLQVESSGERVSMWDNVTDALGRFDVAVPVGTFELLLAPPPGSRLVGQRVSSARFSTDTIWSPLTLNAGILVEVNVLDQSGRPATGADLDFVSEVTLIEAYTPHDNVDSTGTASVALIPDVYTVRVTPPVGSLWFPQTQAGVRISGDTSLAVVLSTGDAIHPEEVLVLHPNYPNPFNGATTIPFSVLRDGDIVIEIFNVLGERVRTLVTGRYAIGVYTTTWDGLDSGGHTTASGVYLYRIRGEGQSRARKLILLR